MTAVQETNAAGQLEYVSYCDQLNAKGEKCHYVARSNQEPEEAEKMVKAHQLARPVEGETDLRPAREIEQHYPHFVSYDQPNTVGAPPSSSAPSAGEQALTPSSPPEPPVTTNVAEEAQHPGTTEQPGGQS